MFGGQERRWAPDQSTPLIEVVGLGVSNRPQVLVSAPVLLDLLPDFDEPIGFCVPVVRVATEADLLSRATRH